MGDVVAIIVVFVGLTWWILKHFLSKRIGRLIYGTWAAVNIATLVMEFAFSFGVLGVFQLYPIVTFSNAEQFFGKDKVAVLLGSDDKQYAFLLVFNVARDEPTPDPSKVILFVPRTEVK